MKIGIIIAMDIEYALMQRLLDGKSYGRIGVNDIVLWQCGIGKVNAAIGTMNLIQQHHPDCIISTGLAGGIDTKLGVLDVMLAAQTCYHDVWCGEGNELGQVQGLPSRFEGDQTLLHYANMLNGREDVTRVMHTGLLCTGDRFITDRNEQQAIKQNFPKALAVDMESAAIAQACYLAQMPFLSVRIISDTPGNTDDHQRQWNDFLNDMCNHSFRWITQYLELLPDNLA